MVVWMHEDPLVTGRTYIAKHTTRTVRATVRSIRYRVDVNTLEQVASDSIAMNEIAEVEFETNLPLFFDSYRACRWTGSLILIDALTNATVGAAMIVQAIEDRAAHDAARPGEYIGYTQPSDLATLDPRVLATKLRDIIAEVSPALEALSAEAAAHAPAPGKWSVQQTFGHLCDSAMNNQQRIVRLQLQPELDLPGYDQDGWIRVQHYELLPWPEVLALWRTLNQHLARTVEHVDPGTLAHVWRYQGQSLSLGFIIEDYIAHLEHHLRALQLRG
jgi:hypothetical protein